MTSQREIVFNTLYKRGGNRKGKNEKVLCPEVGETHKTTGTRRDP